MRRVSVALLALGASLVLAVAPMTPTYGVPGHAKDHGANTAPPRNMKAGAFPKPRYGYGPILIGMTAQALKRTGQVRPSANWRRAIAKAKKYQCASLKLTTAGATVDLQPDRKTGKVKVSALFYGPSMTTSKGIGLGSTLADLQQAYPKVPWVKEMHGPGESPMLLGHHVLYEFGIEQDKHIGELLMYWSGQTCFS